MHALTPFPTCHFHMSGSQSLGYDGRHEDVREVATGQPAGSIDSLGILICAVKPMVGSSLLQQNWCKIHERGAPASTIKRTVTKQLVLEEDIFVSFMCGFSGIGMAFA